MVFDAVDGLFGPDVIVTTTRGWKVVVGLLLLVLCIFLMFILDIFIVIMIVVSVIVILIVVSVGSVVDWRVQKVSGSFRATTLELWKHEKVTN